MSRTSLQPTSAAPGWLRTWIHHCLFYGRPLALAPGLGWAWVLALGCLALYAAFALLFQDGLTRCVQTFETQPGQSVLAALIAMLLTPVLVVLLCITVIGIAAVPFVLLGLFCVALFGKAVMLAWLGRRVAGRHDAGPMSHPVVAVLIGGALVLVLYLVPVLGFLVYKLLGVLGLGAVVYTVILAARAHQAAKVGPGGATSAAGSTAGPAFTSSPAATPGPAFTSSAAPTPGVAPSAGPAFTSGAASAPGPAPAFGPSPPPGAAPTPGAAPAFGPTPPPGATSSPGAAAAAHSPPITAALPRAGFWIRMGALFARRLIGGLCHERTEPYAWP